MSEIYKEIGEYYKKGSSESDFKLPCTLVASEFFFDLEYIFREKVRQNIVLNCEAIDLLSKLVNKVLFHYVCSNARFDAIK